MQMSIIVSSKATLLGTSDSVALGAVVDGIMERRMGADHGAVSRYYRPEVQSPGSGREGAAPAQTTESGPAPAGTANAGAPGAANAGVVPAVVAMAGMPAAAMPGATGTPNININMGGPKPPEEDMLSLIHI